MVTIRRNKILEKNRQGTKGLVCGFVFPCVEAVELISLNGGFDSINLDGEHGLFSVESIDTMCRVADGFGLTVTARVPSIDASIVNTFLDRGAMGITGPHIDTAEEARALVQACRYAPEGMRSWGGGRGTYYNDSVLMDLPGSERTEFMALTNREMLVEAQLETATALENLDAILEVEGIDAFAWGPNDQAQSMGFPGQPDHPAAVEARQRVWERIHAAGRKLSSDLTASASIPNIILAGARGFLTQNH